MFIFYFILIFLPSDLPVANSFAKMYNTTSLGQ